MKKLIAAGALVALLALPLGGAASAQGAPGAAPAPAAATSAERNQGLMLKLGFGVTDCTDDWCDDMDPMVGLQLVALYRLMKYAAVGVHVAFLFGDPDQDYGWLGIGDPDHVWSFFLGLEGRAIYPYKQLDAWVGLSLGYMRVMADGDILGESARTWSDNFALGFGFGLDYYLTSSVALGVSFYLYKPWIYTVCGEAGAYDDCVDLDDSAENDVGIVWWFGASATYVFGR